MIEEVLNKRVGTEITIKVNDYKVKYGTIDRKEATCIYFTLNGYVTCEDDITKHLHIIQKRLHPTVHNSLPNLFELKEHMSIIHNLEYSQFHNVPGRIKFFQFECTWYTKDKQDIKSKELREKIELFAIILIQLLEDHPQLSFLPTKPRKAVTI